MPSSAAVASATGTATHYSPVMNMAHYSNDIGSDDDSRFDVYSPGMDPAFLSSDMDSDSECGFSELEYTSMGSSDRHSSLQYQAAAAKTETSDHMAKPAPGFAKDDTILPAGDGSAETSYTTYKNICKGTIDRLQKHTHKRKGLTSDTTSACENGENTVSESMCSKDNDGASKKTKWPTVNTGSHHSPHQRETHDIKSVTSTLSIDTNAQHQSKWKRLGRGVILTNAPGEVPATANNGSLNTRDKSIDSTVDDKSKIDIALDPNIIKPVQFDNVVSPIPNMKGGRESGQNNDKRDPTTFGTRTVNSKSSTITDVVDMLFAGNNPAQVLMEFIAKCASEPIPFDEFRLRMKGEDKYKDGLEKSDRPICVGGWNGCGERPNCTCLDPKSTTKHDVNPGKPKTCRSEQSPKLFSKFSKCCNLMSDSKLQESKMIDSFLAHTNEELTWKEASLFLRMCGANVKVAHTMYYNMGGLVPARRVLVAWSSLPANGEVVEGSMLPDYPSFGNYWPDTSSSCGSLENMGRETTPTVQAECEATAPADADPEYREAMTTLGLSAYRTVNWHTLYKHFYEARWNSRRAPMLAEKVLSAFVTIIEHHTKNGWKLRSGPRSKMFDEELLQPKSEYVTSDDCKERFPTIKTNFPKAEHAIAGDTQNSGPKYDTGGARENAPYCNDCHESWSSLCDAHEYTASSWTRDAVAGNDATYEAFPQCGWGPEDTEHRASSSPINEKYRNAVKSTEPKAPASSTYTVTYSATIKCGDKTAHIPIDSDDVTGTEKTIIEGEGSMKKVWKWVQERSLGDKISLQDAFDLAQGMHGGDEAQVSEDKSDGVTVQAESKSDSNSSRYWPVRVSPWDSPSVASFSQLPEPRGFPRDRAEKAGGSPEPWN